MDEIEKDQQRLLHEQIEDRLRENGDLPEGTILTGWIVMHETLSVKDSVQSNCGHFYGPNEMTTWRALGIVEWVRRFCLKPDDETSD